VLISTRECLFGEIVNNEMVLNDAGKMVEKWWYELINKFPNIQLDAHIIMPDHFHGIIIITGTDLCVCPDINNDDNYNITGADLCVCPDINDNDNYNSRCEHTGSPLYKIVQWFKTMTTNDYIRNVKTNNWKPFNKKLWQRNYYEHIIRNEIELNRIRKYILNNPLNWEKDKNYKI
jgi:REP element-mobilizing transposase RayT